MPLFDPLALRAARGIVSCARYNKIHDTYSRFIFFDNKFSASRVFVNSHALRSAAFLRFSTQLKKVDFGGNRDRPQVLSPFVLHYTNTVLRLLNC